MINITNRSKKKIIMIIFLITVLFLLRIIFLDADIPPTGIINYQPIDEGAYSYLALNKINYGLINPDFSYSNLQQYTSPSLRLNILGNLISYLSMLFFGKTYYGLRIPSVITVGIIFIIIGFILKELKNKYVAKENKKWNYIIIYIIFYLCLEFTFLIASRVNETSIYRMFFIVLTIFVYIRYEHKPFKQVFYSGFLAAFSMTCIYISNLFFVVALYAIVFYRYFIKKEKKIISYLIIGTILAFILSEIYFIIFWNVGFIQNSLNVFNSFSNLTGYETSTGIYSILKTTIEFFSNNFNFYNIAIFFLVFVNVPILLKRVYLKRDDLILFLLLIFVFYYLQTLFSPDFVRRKFIMVAPILIVLLYISAIIYYTETEDKMKVNKWKRDLFNVVCFIFCLCIIIYRLFITNDGSRLDFTSTNIQFLMIINMIILLSSLILVNSKFTMKKVAFIYILSIITNLYMSINYVYLNPTFSEKEIMIELKEMDLKPKYIVGTYMLGYSLYNDYIPVLNNAEKMKEILANNPDFYYLDYASDNIVNLDNYLEKFMDGTEYKLVEERRFNREFQRYGHKRPIALYKVERK